MANRILVVEDNESLRVGIVAFLEDSGYQVLCASNGAQAIQLLESDTVHIVVSDIKLGDISGVDVLRKAKEINSETEVILMTAYATLDSALQALRLGAFDYIQKPFDLEDLKHRVDTAARLRKMSGELEFFKRAQYRVAMDDVGIVAENPAMKEILATVRKVAPTHATVLITGETGTGKEVLASLVHFQSPRREQPLVKVNCAALHENLLESELFGHERGAFTGAERLRIGKFEQADKGTIFLDEIGDMSATTQAKVLRVMQEHEFERLGSSGKPVKVDVRVVTATNHDLRKEVQEGRFRQDLYFRLNVLQLHIPPLRDRPEDLLPLGRHFLDRYASDFKKKVEGFSPDAVRKLRSYAWPGNVRELQNAIERAVLLCDGPLIGPAELTLESGTVPGSEIPGGDGTLNLEELERGAIERALRVAKGVQKDAADLLGVTPRVLNYKIQVLGIDWKSFRAG
ncbi:sigma-54-dependent transcriptional regulator [Candidatus Deferrimicrobium sp.]|uniref:sigma-54-dependent transcriptional regulator n=1 Tax=Candidatus Deferrimicrobium sp. TaxID=3060586 RepID=UPI003C38D5F2